MGDGASGHGGESAPPGLTGLISSSVIAHENVGEINDAAKKPPERVSCQRFVIAAALRTGPPRGRERHLVWEPFCFCLITEAPPAVCI